MAGRGRKFFETKFFGLVIGVLVFLLLLVLSTQTVLIANLELSVLDFNFRLKSVFRGVSTQEGVEIKRADPKLSPDILIVGIDDRSLDTYGRWPFPRYTHARLIDTFTRIKEPNEREAALFLDIFFVEPSDPAYDALLLKSIEDNGRIFLETVLQPTPNAQGTEEEYFARQELLFQRYGKIGAMTGDWTKLATYLGIYPPLKPYARAARGYGHANAIEDADEVFRRQPLILRSSRLLEELRLEELTSDSLTAQERALYTRLAWVDRQNAYHDVDYPLTAEVIEDLKETMARKAPPKVEETGEGQEPISYYVVRKYRDEFLPAITLVLALEYFHKRIEDIEVVLGRHIRIPAPQVFNEESGAWEPYALVVKPEVVDDAGNVVSPAVTRIVPEILIPINAQGQLLINFMGVRSSASPSGYQTFPVRSYAGYAGRNAGSDPAKWPRTMAMAGKIVMVGPFSTGMAEDEKTTPRGLMFGVEIHANALNTILMNNFLYYVQPWVNTLILLGLALLTAFMASRLPTIWSLVLSLILIVLFFFVITLLFELYNWIITLSAPVFAILLSFLAVIVYRIMTEEKDKRRIRDMFGKYVSPSVVDQILQNPPELGGVDKELSVFFSDIRGFTTLSESMTPQELINHLNRYLTAMTDVIMLFQGTLDKYIGDAIMSFWGAPLPQADHAMLACKCALRQMQVLGELNTSLPPERRLNVGMGINSGIMTVGNMGSLGRMNYTLTGDNVNLGARLEGTNKQYMTNIIISEYTYGMVKGRVMARELDNIRVKGKNKPVQIYELVDVLEGLEPPAPLAVVKGRAG
jgi:adenylate cyclase